MVNSKDIFFSDSWDIHSFILVLDIIFSKSQNVSTNSDSLVIKILLNRKPKNHDDLDLIILAFRKTKSKSVCIFELPFLFFCFPTDSMMFHPEPPAINLSKTPKMLNQSYRLLFYHSLQNTIFIHAFKPSSLFQRIFKSFASTQLVPIVLTSAPKSQFIMFSESYCVCCE